MVARFRGRLLLLLPLAALLAASGYMIRHVPCTTFNGTQGSWLVKDRRSVIFHDEVPRHAPSRTEFVCAAIDIDDQTLTSVELPTGHLVSGAADHDWNLFLLHQPLDPTTGKLRRGDLQLIYVDGVTHEVTIHERVDFPPASFVRVCGGRYLIAEHERQIHVLNTRNPELGSVSIASSAPVSYLAEVAESNRFYVVRENQTPADGTATVNIELFAIDDDRTPKSIANWQAGMAGPKGKKLWGCTGNNEGSIYSLSLDRKELERRSAVDGRQLSSIRWLKHIDWDNVEWEFSPQAITIAGGEMDQCHDFALRDLFWRPGDGVHFYSANATQYFFYQADGKSKVKGYYSSRIRHAFGSIQSVGIHHLEGDLFVQASKCFGYSLRVLDVEAEEVVTEIRPLAWVSRIAITIPVLFVVWTVAWMIVSAREGGPGWIDVLIVLGIPCLVSLVRFLTCGDPYDLRRIPAKHALGCVMAAELLAVTWLVFGKTRFSLRVIPPLALVALFMGVLSVMFQESPWIVWHATTRVVVPALGLLVVLAVIRAFSWRLEPPRYDSSARTVDQSLGRTRYPLRDLILITVVAAMLFAATQRVADSIGQAFEHDILSLVALVFVLIFSPQAILSALRNSRALFVAGCIGVGLGMTLLIGEAVSMFIDGRSMKGSFDRSLLQSPMTCIAALFVGLIPFRLRGWRMCRRSAEGSETVEAGLVGAADLSRA